ncbi:Clathrin interactor EPSIN 2 [Platanthera guangdongensis]|uniref:Clathrin interactor EPSIN 2 n=1 Tax=Platanthera guangdongensis TaxID=2320717 RepID=A0ABR2MA24_9ASPA
MKKAFDQTVRELKREVNKKVLKVPGVEQKILDATSNELWGPHGSLLADIAQATRNYQEYQIIMHVIWKRLNDTGKNWRHVYKSLTVLEYLVGHGAERVVDEIKEHAYQISTLSDFQYIDSSGKDQGNNVRRKSQALVSLVNDKERIQEIRQKALANKDKYRPAFSSGGSHKSTSSSGYGDRYDDDRYEGRYGSRDDDRNGYGRERDLGYKDDDRYAKDGEFYKNGDGYSRDSDEHSGRGSYKNDDHRSGRGNDDYQFGPRKSFDKDREHSYEEDESYSYRNGGGRANDASPDERHIERKLSERSVGAPPNYESAVRNDDNKMLDEGDGEVGTSTDSKTVLPAAPKASSPQNTSHDQQHAVAGVPLTTASTDDSSFDEFDPRGFTPAINFAPPAAVYTSFAANGSAVDLFGSTSSLDPVDSLALVLAAPITSSTETEMAATNSGFGMDFVALSSASVALTQPAEDPFGDVPFKAISHETFPNQQQNSVPPSSSSSFASPVTSLATSEPVLAAGPLLETTSLDFDFGDSLGGLTYMPPASNSPFHSANPTVIASESPFAPPNIDPLSAHPGPSNLPTTNMMYGYTSFPAPGLPALSSHASQHFPSANAPPANAGFLPQQLGSSIPPALPQQLGSSIPPAQPMTVPQRTSPNISAPSNAKPVSDAFETKSSVWADTLNRGLVNLNISGAKTNPLSDIGVDFDSINRLERRKEKSSVNSMSSAAAMTMGKAMGSGSGIGRGAAINQAMRPTMGMGMGVAGPGFGGPGGVAGPGFGGPGGMGMGMRGSGPGPGGMGLGMGGGGPGYGGPGGMGMGIGSYGGSMNPGIGMGMGMAGRPLPEMQSPATAFPGGAYNNPTGTGGYGPHQPYGGAYR